MSAAEAVTLATVTVRNDHDVFAMRGMGREVAAAAGMSEQDQIRVATALSEVGRDIVSRGGAQESAEVAFLLEHKDLVVAVSPPPGGHSCNADGVKMALRLMDEVKLGDPDKLIMRKRLPGRRPPSVDQIRAKIGTFKPVSALDELRRQNLELASTLEEVRQLNTELQETNRGVMALYNQLSVELEETNRGVVALYAELDDKSLRLRRASDAKDRFWATISHELRTPLNSIIGLVRLLTGSGAQPLGTEERHQIDLIGSSAHTLLDTVDELLDMAKAESGRLDPHLTLIDLHRLVEDLRLSLLPTADSTRIRLTVHLPPPPQRVLADEAMLARILRNLLANSLKFTEQGEVALQVTHDVATGEIIFTVVDTGIGIAPEHLAHVFEEFYQVPGPAQLRAKGTGLGLAYARRLAEAMGGTLELTSVEGQGTTATLRLARLSDVPVVNRVLIADDDDDFRAHLRRMLTGLATYIDEARDGEAALRAMRATPPDVALLDVMMPGLGGTALLQRMGEDKRLHTIPAILITADPVKHHPDLGVAVLGKSALRRDTLLRALQRVLEGKGGPV
ncbi:ATP-binding response regulator [Sinosporangium siamense]|uniref:histidine kinase n=1 Tax=Sinosporangium siamense TaxID=1367973 RepID=A0A919RNA7_9ACTN|nr:ATP-binding protein [Sinosporangium siamense]GII96922.1 sensor histidine kinase [Sinosporangium siamense]